MTRRRALLIHIIGAGALASLVLLAGKPGKLSVQELTLGRLRTSADPGDLAFSPNGKWVALATSSGIYVWELPVKKELVRGGFSAEWKNTRVAFSPDSRTLAIGGKVGSVKLFETCPWRLRGTTGADIDWVTQLTFHPHRQWLFVSGYSDRRPVILLWDLAMRRVRYRLKPSKIGVRNVRVSPDGKLLLSISEGAVQVRATDSGEQLWTFRAHPEPLEGLKVVSSAAFFPDSRTIATAGYDGKVRLWDVTLKAAKGTLSGGLAQTATGVAVAADGKLLVAVGNDKNLDNGGRVEVWDVTAGRLRASFIVPGESVLSAWLSPDGQWLAIRTAPEAKKERTPAFVFYLWNFVDLLKKYS